MTAFSTGSTRSMRSMAASTSSSGTPHRAEQVQPARSRPSRSARRPQLRLRALSSGASDCALSRSPDPDPCGQSCQTAQGWKPRLRPRAGARRRREIEVGRLRVALELRDRAGAGMATTFGWPINHARATWDGVASWRPATSRSASSSSRARSRFSEGKRLIWHASPSAVLSVVARREQTCASGCTPSPSGRSLPPIQQGL